MNILAYLTIGLLGQPLPTLPAAKVVEPVTLQLAIPPREDLWRLMPKCQLAIMMLDDIDDSDEPRMKALRPKVFAHAVRECPGLVEYSKSGNKQ